MNTQPTLDQIDPDILDAKLGGRVPTSFIEEHFDPVELAEHLDVSADELWLAVRDGRLPRPVVLPTNPPLHCWSCGVIAEWQHAGCPVDPLHQAHQTMVYSKLMDACRDLLSARPVTQAERN